MTSLWRWSRKALARTWNQRLWHEISADEYADAFRRFGGSFAVHPAVVRVIERLSGIPVRYVGHRRDGALIAAVPTWGEHIVGSKATLNRFGQSHLIDVGEAEVVLPMAEGVKLRMPFKADLVSDLHLANITNLVRLPTPQMLAKCFDQAEHEHSGKTTKKLRRCQRLFEKAGGVCRSLEGIPADELTAIYSELFEKRWSFPTHGREHLGEVLRELRPLLCGHMLHMRGRPIALHLIYRVETPRWLFANYVNGGMDPEFREFSPGSLLNFLNVRLLEDEARSLDKQLRFSFGRKDADYKSIWAYETPLHQLE